MGLGIHEKGAGGVIRERKNNVGGGICLGGK